MYFPGFAMELFATALFILVLVSLNDKAAETQNISSPFVPFVLGVVYAAAQMATVSCNLFFLPWWQSSDFNSSDNHQVWLDTLDFPYNFCFAWCESYTGPTILRLWLDKDCIVPTHWSWITKPTLVGQAGPSWIWWSLRNYPSEPDLLLAVFKQLLKF